MRLRLISVSVFKVISVTVSVSFFTRSFLYVCSISIENLFSISFSMSFTDINHFCISLSFSYWNTTGDTQYPHKSTRQEVERNFYKIRCVAARPYSELARI